MPGANANSILAFMVHMPVGFNRPMVEGEGYTMHPTGRFPFCVSTGVSFVILAVFMLFMAVNPALPLPTTFWRNFDITKQKRQPERLLLFWDFKSFDHHPPYPAKFPGSDHDYAFKFSFIPCSTADN